MLLIAANINSARRITDDKDRRNISRVQIKSRAVLIGCVFILALTKSSAVSQAIGVVFVGE
ncbi:MAG: hypothetical protein LBF86_09645 [Helicobacteraceae bacterium]|jgi:hypothetical protein|nr:hypothetical protein [Helicobacteraceae bacterium]